LVGEDQNASDVRIFRVRSDIYPGGPFVDIASDAALEGNSASAVRTQYELIGQSGLGKKAHPILMEMVITSMTRIQHPAIFLVYPEQIKQYGLLLMI
jgi:hypothetical protein